MAAGLLVALLLPGTARADTATATTAPAAPSGGYASTGCDDAVLDGVVWCSVVVSWSPGADDGGSPITGFTVTGNVSDRPSTVSASGATPGWYEVTWRWNPTAHADRGADTSYTVTATNAVGTSAPATVSVRSSLAEPHERFDASTSDNGKKKDVLGFSFPGRPAPTGTATVRVNGTLRAVTTTYGMAELTLKDRNGRKPTLYTVRHGRIKQRLIAA